MKQNVFDPIRSFRDEEVHSYLSKIIDEPLFHEALAYQFGKEKVPYWLDKITTFQSIHELQQELLLPLLENLLRESVEKLTYSGTEALHKNTSYLYISNHRDILMDSFILNYILFIEGFDTIESAIGNNLFVMPWIEHLARLNKSFVVKRNLEGKALYEASLILSLYMKDTLFRRQQSLWIAQQEGRSKNGDDFTQPSLIKMLLMASDKGEESNLLNQYHIVPVSVSYEYDPCDYLKAKEMQLKRDNPDYVKTVQEDLLNMKTGITGFKGRVFYKITPCISDELVKMEVGMHKNELFEKIANLIDHRIHVNYHLYPGNYVAADMLDGLERFSDSYSAREKENFASYLKQQLDKIDLEDKDEDFLRKRMLEMYANPLKNKLKAEKQI